MKQEIICEECKPMLEKIANECKKYGETGEFVHGKAKDDFLCDQCGKRVPFGHPCWAVSILTSTQTKIEGWEDRYIERG